MGTFGEFSRRGRRCKGGRDFGGPVRPVFDDAGGRSAKPDYKTAALCKQVRRIVSLALSGECGDPVLQELLVDDVLPAPNAGRLLVRVLLRAHEGGPGVADVLMRLARVEGLLRADISEAIARKRTPELAFVVMPYGGIGDEARGIGVPPMSSAERTVLEQFALPSAEQTFGVQGNSTGNAAPESASHSALGHRRDADATPATEVPYE